MGLHNAAEFLTKLMDLYRAEDAARLPETRNAISRLQIDLMRQATGTFPPGLTGFTYGLHLNHR